MAAILKDLLLSLNSQTKSHISEMYEFSLNSVARVLEIGLFLRVILVVSANRSQQGPGIVDETCHVTFLAVIVLYDCFKNVM